MKERIKALFITPLGRTASTAAPLAAAIGLCPIVIEDLAEVRLGDFEGGEYRLRRARGDPVVQRVFESERWDEIPGAESPESLEVRVRAGMEAIRAGTGADAAAVAVLLGGVIGEICRQTTSSRLYAFLHCDNGSITRVVFLRGDRCWLRSFATKPLTCRRE